MALKLHITEHDPGRSQSPQGASRRSEDPASEAVGHVGSVTRGRSEALIEVVIVDGSAVVLASSRVGSASTRPDRAACLGEDLLEASAMSSSGSAVADHEEDLVKGAGADLEAAALTVVGLHETRVDDAVVGGVDADAALALLHDYREDEAGVDASLAGDLPDGSVDVGNLLRRIVLVAAVPLARVLHDGGVDGPELFVRAPGIRVGPAGLGSAVALVEAVRVRVGGRRSQEFLGWGTESRGGKERSDSKLGEHLDRLFRKRTVYTSLWKGRLVKSRIE